jgi:hypothetical protein
MIHASRKNTNNQFGYCSGNRSRRSLTLSATLRLAVSMTIWSRSQGSYSRETTSCQVGSLNPLISVLLVSTLFRCWAGSEHVTSTSMALARARSATLVQTSRVSRSGLTESATTVLPRRRLSSIIGDRVTDPIARIIKRLADQTGVADGLLHRVNAQIYCAKLAS